MIEIGRADSREGAIISHPLALRGSSQLLNLGGASSWSQFVTKRKLSIVDTISYDDREPERERERERETDRQTDRQTKEVATQGVSNRRPVRQDATRSVMKCREIFWPEIFRVIFRENVSKISRGCLSK